LVIKISLIAKSIENNIKLEAFEYMSKDSDTGYWSKLILQIRSSMILSQEQFAEAVFSNQATISRWEKGLVIPSIDKQKLIEKIAEESGLSSLNGIAEVVRESPNQMTWIQPRSATDLNEV